MKDKVLAKRLLLARRSGHDYTPSLEAFFAALAKRHRDILISTTRRQLVDLIRKSKP